MLQDVAGEHDNYQLQQQQQRSMEYCETYLQQ